MYLRLIHSDRYYLFPFANSKYLITHIRYSLKTKKISRTYTYKDFLLRGVQVNQHFLSGTGNPECVDVTLFSIKMYTLTLNAMFWRQKQYWQYWPFLFGGSQMPEIWSIRGYHLQTLCTGEVEHEQTKEQQ